MPVNEKAVRTAALSAAFTVPFFLQPLVELGVPITSLAMVGGLIEGVLIYAVIRKYQGTGTS